MKYDTVGVKSKYYLPDFIARDLQQTPQKSTNWYTFNCPLHGHKHNFIVSTSSEVCTCLAGCGALQYADIFSYVQATRKVDFKTAYALLDNKDLPPLDKSTIRDISPKRDFTPIFTAQVKRLMDFMGEAESYFTDRGLLSDNLYGRYLSVDKMFHHRAMYEFENGKKVFLKGRRYIFPRLNYKNQVLGVNARRDDAFIDDLFKTQEELIQEILEDYNRRNEEDLDAKALREILFPRYRRWTGSDATGLFNMRRVIDETGTPKRLSALAVVENERNAYMLEDWSTEFGFNAVAINGLRKLDKALSNTKYVLFISDNDQPRVGIDGISRRAGWEKMSTAWEMARHKNAKIATVPTGKSIDDFVALEGKNTVQNWLAKQGISPIERQYLDY